MRTSTRLLPLVLALLLPVLPSCFGGTGIVSFPINEMIPEQIVPGASVPSSLPLAFAIPFTVDLTAQTNAHNTGPARHVYVKSIAFDITTTKEPAGDTDNFDFLSSAEIFIEGSTAGTTLTKQRIAHLSPVPRGVQSIEFVSDGVDIIDYVKEGAKITVSATGTVPPDDTSFDGEMELSAEVL